MQFLWDRRTFLKASLAGVMALATAGNALAKIAGTEPAPEGKLRLFNTHNRERLEVVFRDQAGNYDQEALAALNWILRCHYTNHVANMDVRTLEILSRVDKQLGGGHEIHIISGYRSPDYNRLLRERGRHVARHSLHLEGKAIDIAIPGVELARVRQSAVGLRGGGVGYYPGAGFVHVDSGTFRTW